MFQIINNNLFLIRIDKPVFPYAGLGILRKFQAHVPAPGGWRKNLCDKIRRSINNTLFQLVPITNYQNIRFHHCAVIAVKLYIQR